MSFSHNHDAVAAMWAESRRQFDKEEKATEFEIIRKERPKDVTKHRTKARLSRGKVTGENP